nr:PREDICTED: alpha-1D adrenergic receptor-like [Latimeria chalumnae]|eukprot:XP_006013461.2 PREDICTED: alpha-1D adrenergic receptor-like [Latimeria chalumnae]
MTFLDFTNNSVNGNYSRDNVSRSVLAANFENNTNLSSKVTLDAQAISLGVVLATFILFAIVGNLLVILSVACNRHLQTVTNYFIINLAIADLLLSTTVLPFSATLEVLGFWVFGRIFCNIWAAVDVLCCTASIMSLCIISIDRYIGVKYSLKYPTIMTERKAVIILIVVWLSSMVISIGPLLGWKEPPPENESICSITEEPGYALFSSLFSFYLPLMVILVMYFRIYVVARRTTKNLEAGVKKERDKSMEVVLRIHCRSVLEEATASSRNKGHHFRSSLSVRLLKFSREKKAAKTLAIVVGVFILCWLPFFFVLPLDAIIDITSGLFSWVSAVRKNNLVATKEAENGICMHKMPLSIAPPNQFGMSNLMLKNQHKFLKQEHESTRSFYCNSTHWDANAAYQELLKSVQKCTRNIFYIMP